MIDSEIAVSTWVRVHLFWAGSVDAPDGLPAISGSKFRRLYQGKINGEEKYDIKYHYQYIDETSVLAKA